jgi:hypothetical protein
MTIPASEVDEVAAEVSHLTDHELASAFRARAVPDARDDPWLLLANVFDIHLRPSNPYKPFGPMLVMDDKRTMVPADLTDPQIDILRQLLDAATNAAVRCRLGDVLWAARRNGRAGAKAVVAYLEAGILVEDADMWPPSMERYERAVRLARSLGRTSPLLTAALQHLVDRVTRLRGQDPSFFTCRALELLEEFRFGDPGSLSEYAQTAARQRSDDPRSARTYWDIAAKLLARAGLPRDAEQARIESAQTWVKEADQTEAAGNLAAVPAHLDSAIKAYRAIPSCKHLIPGLHRRLDAAGAEALKLMKPISSAPIDIEPLVKAAQDSVRGRPLQEAVYAVACAASYLDPGRMRSNVVEAAEKSPLSSMFSEIVYDCAGRAVHKSPGLFTDDPDEREQAIEARVSRHADMVRDLTVAAQIMPALMALLGEHTPEEADIAALLEGSVFVPEERRGLFATGLAAGFGRDLIAAMHLLIPQLEHALRVLLRDAGTITTSIDHDGIQSEWPLGRLLSAEVIRPVLPETLAFELRSLLIYKGGSNLRNKLCHGLLSANEFGTANVVYTWWLLLGLSLHGTSGFHAWLDERVRSQREGESDGEDELAGSMAPE